MNHFKLVGIAIITSMVMAAILVASVEATEPSDVVTQSLDASKITTSWNLSFLYKDKYVAKEEYQKLNTTIGQINQTFKPRFNT